MNNLELLKDAQKIAVCTDSINSVEKVYSLLLIYYYLKDQNKDLTVISSNGVANDYRSLLENHGVDVSTEVSQKSYVVTINYSESGVDKLYVDKNLEEGEIKFYIIPKSGEFDFNNIDYSTEGHDFDLVVTLGVQSFHDLGAIYKDNNSLFKDNKVLSIAKGVDSLGDSFVKVPDEENINYHLSKMLSKELNEQGAQVALDGVVQTEEVLDKDLSSEDLELFADLVRAGAKWAKAIDLINDSSLEFNSPSKTPDKSSDKSNSSEEETNQNTQKKTRSDQADVAVAKISTENLTQQDLNSLSLSNMTDSNYQLGFLVKSKDNGDVQVRVESRDMDKYPASKFAQVYNGNGSSSLAIFEIENVNIDSYVSKLSSIVSDVYDIDNEVEIQNISNSLDLSEYQEQNASHGGESLTGQSHSVRILDN